MVALHPYQVLTAADVTGPSAADTVGRHTLRYVAQGASVRPTYSALVTTLR
ncbi:hypothetical protein ACOZ38_36495 [Sphaerisporangium viridialbum]|uniref:hypothetical protein n=1 Tax=Sphaerisporangium viridialbum TaxID=46189 RepID=UPI003C71828D